MGFVDSYKKLEKLCNEIYGDKHGLSSYIDEMTNNPIGSCYVSEWDENLKQLKHYRWVRNQIVHEPGCTEGNMCELEDVLWLDDFYSRIMNQTDPLAMYVKATKPHTAANPTQKHKTEPVTYNNLRRSSRRRISKRLLQNYFVYLVYLVCILIIVGAVILFSKII